MTKIEKSKQIITPFGGINYIISYIKEAGVLELIDNQLGKRVKQAEYSYSDLILNLWSVFFTGGDCAEDINEHLHDCLSTVPNTKVANADTILGVLKKLKTRNESVTSSSGKIYETNRHDKLNQLNISILKQLNLLKSGNYYDFDYDNEILPTEKQDTKKTYKKVKGYFPGMATVNGNPVYFENRDGNMNVKTDQAAVLQRCYKMLKDNGIKINRSRMDAGSYSFDIVKTALEYSNLIYIRANRSDNLSDLLLENREWKKAIINGKGYEVCSVEYQPFKHKKNLAKITFRLVVSREKTGDPQQDMFTKDNMKYRSILTNDRASTEEEIIEYYNQRGKEEKEIDILNNDFGWSKMPFSNMNENTVFLTIMMIAKNIYTWLISIFSKTFKCLEKHFRIKKFIFRFVIVPAKWIKRSRYNVLKVFSKKPYELLKL